MTKIIVCGSRDFDDYDFVSKEIDKFIVENNFDIVEIVSGGCRGVDALGEKYAVNSGLPWVEFKANWDKYGKSAGPIRNTAMSEYADACIAFCREDSKGTKDMLKKAENKELIIKKICI